MVNKSDPKLASWMSKKRHQKERNPTRAENIFRAVLDKHDVNYVPQKTKSSRGIKRIFDFWIRRNCVIVEIDGLYHDPVEDRKKDAHLLKIFPSWRIARFTNKQIEEDAEGCFASFIKFIHLGVRERRYVHTQ